ncbi:hypothetical protein [Nocardioides deserti]|uniref:Uncharacterized protein n=1 Tax=Nocardioides deserti TaxID=1588644 RepID=A0ABR6UA66_9ACTN|nr:hypothetical protein [Nocardioides deserti]MBC2960849.1 hypothetical protein [Nocardioides deserti]GGO77564.1 hypothetical protein GCM10012276_32960 [Nocardioides deserti]
MNHLTVEIARAHMDARLGEATRARRSSQLARSIRNHRKAEQAVQQARTDLARAL